MYATEDGHERCRVDFAADGNQNECWENSLLISCMHLPALQSLRHETLLCSFYCYGALQLHRAAKWWARRDQIPAAEPAEPGLLYAEPSTALDQSWTQAHEVMSCKAEKV